MNEWHPEDIRPVENDHVLLFFEAGGLSPYSIGYYCEGEWHELHGDNDKIVDWPPTHWMELPDAPQ